MAKWTGPEIFCALQETRNQLPPSAWLHYALADVCRLLGAKATRGELCESWGFDVPRQAATDDELIDWAKRWQT